jgi:uncharacterized protein (DUF885 family)
MNDIADTLSALPPTALPRQVADAYLEDLIRLDPITGTFLGVRESATRLPDFSPAGRAEFATLFRAALARLDVAERCPDVGADADVERRCSRLLRERLTAELAVYEAGEEFRVVSNTHSPMHAVRDVFAVMPTESEDDWMAIAERLQAVPDAVEGYRDCLELGLKQQMHGGPRPTAAFVEQLTAWAGGEKPGWFEEFVAVGPKSLRAGLDSAAQKADESVAILRDWMREVYTPAVADASDAVGRERYVLWSRFFNGTELDLHEAYEYGWSEYHRLLAEMRAEAEKVLPGAESPWAALRHLDEHGTHIEGVAEVQAWLQALMDEAIEELDGSHFALAERVRKVEARIAPQGGGAAPYYYPPAEDFSRPGTTWLPTMGRTRFPVYDLVSTWYHEGVPGHHLQLAQWVHIADSLSRYQTTIGWVSANCEGWALYAERLMDQLGFLGDPERRLGYLDAQMMRALRVIIDIGMHVELEIPADSPFHPGERWTPDLAEEFFRAHSGRPPEFVTSELTRYLSMPAQAIGYKIGERAWLLGRERAQQRHGDAFDLKAWHMQALSLGSLGLDDLVDELSKL